MKNQKGTIKVSGLENKIDFQIERYDFIEEIKGENCIYIFGAGSLADTITVKLRECGIHCFGALVDKKYYKGGATVNGIKVYEWESFVPECNIVVVMAMSDMKRELEIEKREFVKKVVYPGCVGFENDKLLDESYLRENLGQYEDMLKKLADISSKEILSTWINSCLSRYNPMIFPFCNDKVGYFNRIDLQFSEIGSYINIGAYTGDTIEEFLLVNNMYDRIYAIEIDEKMNSYLERKYKNDKRINVVKKAFWNYEGEIIVAQCDNANSVGSIIKNSGNGNRIKCITLDQYFTEDKGKIDLISIALRGQENVLAGGGKLIKRDHPMIVAKVGFERDGVIKVINTIYEIDSSYAFYLRFKDNRTEELTVYAVRKGNL